MNPADLLTRGLDTKMFNEKKQLWFQGPPWLRNPEDTWPPQPEPSSIHTEYENPQLAVTIMADIKENPNILNIIELTKYSTLTRVVRITALLVLFARKWKTPEAYNDNILTTKEILEARNLLLKATQQITYQKEISYLKNGDKFKEPAIVRQLNLYLDDEDLLRCRGRLQYTDLPHDTKFPILMPKDNYLTSLIVQSMHKTVMHGGVCETLTQLRQTYWIPQGRQLVKRIISKCMQKNLRTTISICTYTTSTQTESSSITGLSIYWHRLRRSSLCSRPRKSNFIQSLRLSVHLCRNTSRTPRVSRRSDNPSLS